MVLVQVVDEEIGTNIRPKPSAENTPHKRGHAVSSFDDITNPIRLFQPRRAQLLA